MNFSQKLGLFLLVVISFGYLYFSFFHEKEFGFLSQKQELNCLSILIKSFLIIWILKSFIKIFCFSIFFYLLLIFPSLFDKMSSHFRLSIFCKDTFSISSNSSTFFFSFKICKMPYMFTNNKIQFIK